MRPFLWLTILILPFLATAANAGAWLREKGSSFTSISFSATWFGDTANSSYLEYGVRDDLTLGTDIGYSNSTLGIQSGYGTIFLRRPIGKNAGPNKWAYELGVGAAWINDIVLPYVKTGLSWGRGFTIHEKSGWIAVDASVTWELSLGNRLTKIDTTVGVNFTDVTTGMVQLYLADLANDSYASIAPSLVFKPRKGKFRIQIGAETQLDNFDNPALKLGIWREF